MATPLADPFGTELRIGDEVFFAGTDSRRKPTINRGRVEDLDLLFRKVLVLREGRSGNRISDSVQRLVWVDIVKVGVIPPPSER